MLTDVETIYVNRVHLENLIALAYELVSCVERQTIEQLRKAGDSDVTIIDTVARVVHDQTVWQL